MYPFVKSSEHDVFEDDTKYTDIVNFEAGF